MILTSTPNIEGRRIVKYLGLVTAAVEACMAEKPGGLFSNPPKYFVQETLREPVGVALRVLTESAHKAGADAIAGTAVHFEGGFPNQATILVTAVGTAVKLES